MHDLHSLIWMVVIGILVGWVASLLVEGKGLGLLPDMVIGILGAFVGSFLADKFNVHFAGFWGSLAVSVFGAVVLLVLIRLLKPAR